jgi:hypothetical protein
VAVFVGWAEFNPATTVRSVRVGWAEFNPAAPDVARPGGAFPGIPTSWAQLDLEDFLPRREIRARSASEFEVSAKVKARAIKAPRKAKPQRAKIEPQAAFEAWVGAEYQARGKTLLEPRFEALAGVSSKIAVRVSISAPSRGDFEADALVAGRDILAGRIAAQQEMIKRLILLGAV